jgi:predicted transport protein
MALFKIDGKIVKKIAAKELDLERNLQEIFEENLNEILNIDFLAHEYSTSFGGRIDTLGLDKNGSPCIIEYKRNQNDNVINQGLSYLRWLLDHKADFEILCQNNKVEIDIDWDSPRVICIAENYNKFDLDTVEILPIKVELFRYRIYDNNILYIEAENSQKIKISTSKILKKSKHTKEKEERLQKTYTVDHHLAGISSNTVELFEEMREKILSLDENIVEEAKAKYIAYKLTTNFVDVVILKGSLKLFLNISSGNLNDPDNLARDLAKPKKIGHWGNGDYEVQVTSQTDLEKVQALIKQSYNLNK